MTEIFDYSQVPEDQRVDIDHGSIWVGGMQKRWNGWTGYAQASQEQLRRASAGPTLPEAALAICGTQR